jgi:hypothetical protein
LGGHGQARRPDGTRRQGRFGGGVHVGIARR